MKWVLIFLTFLAAPAVAQTVVVKSGDHADFTRLVLTFADGADWQLGRIDGGYELQRGDRRETFDVSDVYRLITKARLKSIWVDPITGRLQMGVGCACHAIPFEFNQNTLVIDIRDGVPPEGSIFEQARATGKPLPPLGQPDGRTVVRTAAPRPAYDWLDLDPTAKSSPQGPGNASARTAFTADVQSDGFRNAVIGELARGATAGVVDIVPSRLADVSTGAAEDVSNARVVLGDQFKEIAGVAVSDGSSEPRLTEKGGLCPDEERVDLAAWSTVDGGADRLTSARALMLGEFDQPSADGIQTAVRAYLYLGFGAEARNLMRAFPVPVSADPLAVGLSYLVDGESASENPFAGLQTCDSAAAFWAIAAAQEQTSLAGLNGAAVARTFMGLPQHLKLVFAQTTINRLLRAGDAANAEIVRSALTRAAPTDAGIVPMVEAEIALHQGAPEKAETKLGAVSDVKLAADALLALVEARFQQRRTVDEKEVLGLEAFAFETRGGDRDGAFRRALAHAQALSGDFAAAFAAAADDAALRSDTWMLLAELGQPTDLLVHLVGEVPVAGDRIPSPTKAIFARRLTELGLPNAARSWLPDSPQDLALSAEVALGNKDARSALRTLASDLSAADPALLARALQDSGEFSQAATVLRNAGDPEGANRLDRWAGIWDAAPPRAASGGQAPRSGATILRDMSDENVWDELAALRTPVPHDAARPALQAGHQHLVDSAATRAAIAALLSTLPELSP